MKLRLNLTPAILLPVAATIFVVAGLVMYLSSASAIATVERTLASGQSEMIEVLTGQFAGSVRFGKMEAVEESFAAYQADPDFGLAAAGAVDAQGQAILQFGADTALSGKAIEIAKEALAANALVSRVDGTIHYAAYPAVYGKENAIVGSVVMAWDLSIHRAEIIGLQMRNGLIALGIAVVGMALLAWLPDPEIEAILSLVKPALAEYPKITPKLLEREIERSRERSGIAGDGFEQGH